MNAGRELDALVAEKVMGWTIYPVGECEGKPKPHAVSLHDCMVVNDDGPLRLWNPSTDLVAAWRVVEHMQRRWEALDEKESQFWRFDDCYPFGWGVRVIWPKDGEAEIASVAGDTLPLAICVAALVALGVEVSG